MAGGHGGKRAKAGRPVGAVSKATAEAKATLAELARVHAPEALDTLVSLMRSAESEMARKSAADSLLDRGYGKAPQALDLQQSGEVTIRVISGVPRADD